MKTWKHFCLQIFHPAKLLVLSIQNFFKLSKKKLAARSKVVKSSKKSVVVSGFIWTSLSKHLKKKRKTWPNWVWVTHTQDPKSSSMSIDLIIWSSKPLPSLINLIRLGFATFQSLTTTTRIIYVVGFILLKIAIRWKGYQHICHACSWMVRISLSRTCQIG